MASSDFHQIGLVFICSLAAFVGFGRVALKSDGAPRVVLLGSGKHLSALVVAGNDRLLIASGTDGSAFLNAFAQALPFTDRRIDVLVIAGDRGDLPSASAARSSIHAERTFVLDGELSGSLDQLHLNASSILAGGRTIRLGSEIVVTIETASIQTGSAPLQGWQAVVEHGASRVRIVSDARLLGAFHDRRRASALVIAGAPEAATLRGSFLSLVAPSSISDAAPLLGSDTRALPVLKVEPGRSVELTFSTVGLKLPKGAQFVSASPVP